MALGKARAWGAVATVAALALTACGGGSKKNGDTAVGSNDLLVTTVPAQTVPGATRTTMSGATATTARPGSPAPTLPTSRTTTASQGFVYAGSGSAVNDAKGPTGAFARGLLQATPYTSIRYELLAQGGAAVSQTAVNHITGILRNVSKKTVTVAGPVPLPGGSAQWSAAAIDSFADRYGTPNTGSGVAVMHVLALHGSFNGDNNVAGIAIRGDVLAVFVDQYQSHATPFVTADELQVATLTHETGHMLGLVDEVLHDGRGDPNDPSHCLCHSQDKNSVMYWVVDTFDVTKIFTNGPPTDFDQLDYGDLAQIHNGA